MSQSLESGIDPEADRIPARAGLGLKQEHGAEILRDGCDVAFFEVHAENYMGDGGPPHALLRAVRERFPLSLHGVGLSIGGEGPLCKAHLARLRRLVELYRPGLFSEHLAWSSHGGVYLNDLLPLPYTSGMLDRICAHIEEAQDAVGMRMLLENPSSYLTFETSTIDEVDFLSEIVRRTGCGLLLDINNVYVSAVNLGFDPLGYVAAFPLAAVGEIHLGGHAEDSAGQGPELLIDAHNAPVAESVWQLYRSVIEQAGPIPTLVEWDNDVPSFAVLAAEAARAEAVMRDAAGGRSSA